MVLGSVPSASTRPLDRLSLPFLGPWSAGPMFQKETPNQRRGRKQNEQFQICSPLDPPGGLGAQTNFRESAASTSWTQPSRTRGMRVPESEEWVHQHCHHDFSSIKRAPPQHVDLLDTFLSLSTSLHGSVSPLVLVFVCLLPNVTLVVIETVVSDTSFFPQ